MRAEDHTLRVTFTCDRCGYISETTGSPNDDTGWDTATPTGWHYFNITQGHLYTTVSGHLCPECSTAFSAFMGGE